MASAIAAFWRRPRLNVVGMSSRRVAELQPFEQFLGLRLPVPHAVQAADVLEVLPQRQVVVEGGRVAEPAERPPRIDAARAMTHDARLAPAGVEQPGGHAQQRGLAAAVVADECNVLPLGHLEVERLERGPVAVVLGELMGAEGGGHAELLCWAVYDRPSSMNLRMRWCSRSRTFTQ